MVLNLIKNYSRSFFYFSVTAEIKTYFSCIWRVLEFEFRNKLNPKIQTTEN